MKRLKKLMALIIAVAMIIGAMSMTAFAADGDPTGSITVKPSDSVSLENKTLTAYKILDATYGTGDPQPVAYTIPAAMTDFFDDYFSSETQTASELAKAAGKTLDVYVTDIMAAWNDDATEIKNFEYAALEAAKAANLTAIAGAASGDNVVFSNLEAGYYIIEDEGSATPISALMLNTVTNANVEITLKASDESEKEIMTAEELINNKANELGIGRTVNYKYTQKVPDTTGYDYYYYMINDTLSTGLTFDPTSVVVKVGDTTLTEGTDYYLYADKTADAAVLGTKTFIVAFNDVVADIAAEKYATGDTITVTYNATINSDAVVGVDPNNNKANITYSNNPDKDGKGDFDEDHPGIPKNDENHPTGEGPDKWTDSYTEKISILKVDGTDSDNPLAGVEFTLTGTSKDAVFDAEEVFEIDPSGEYWLLKNGTYTTTAPQTLPTLQVTTGGAGWVEDASYTDADARVVGGKTYRPYVEATDSGETRYIIIEANTGDYTSTTTKYKKVVVTGDAAEEYSVARTGITDSNGNLDFSQLGAGTYKLSETGVLAGYNGLADIEFTLTCTLPKAEDVIAGTEQATWEITDVSPANATFVQQSDGTFKITLQNNKGTELPSTGGIGTTIFYVVGSLLVVGAGVILITRRRMNVN
jgi:fimbrial isopeptide formation D2 family protein/LPXTG-motif cell wall-anchored protein